MKARTADKEKEQEDVKKGKRIHLERGERRERGIMEWKAGLVDEEEKQRTGTQKLRKGKRNKEKDKTKGIIHTAHGGI